MPSLERLLRGDAEDELKKEARLVDEGAAYDELVALAAANPPGAVRPGGG